MLPGVVAKGLEVLPLGFYSQGNGYWVRYANADTDLDLTECDVHGIWTDAGEVPNGEGGHGGSSQGLGQALQEQGGHHTASQHFLADVFAQAAVKENGDIPDDDGRTLLTMGPRSRPSNVPAGLTANKIATASEVKRAAT